MKPLLALLEQRAQEFPYEPVLVCNTRSYLAHELVLAVQELAAALRASGAEVVALYADNSPEWAVVDLACQSLQICLIPIPTFFSRQQIIHVMKTAAVELLLYDARLSKHLTGLGEADTYNSLGGYETRSFERRSKTSMPVGTNKVTFTSGSTGNPKGVCLSNAQCLTVGRSLAAVTRIKNPRHLCVLPLSTLLENIAGLYMPLLSNGCCVILEPWELGMTGSSGLDLALFLKAIDSNRANSLILVPELLSALDRALLAGWQAPASLEFVAVGGARVSPELLERVTRAGVPVYEGYGLSECASVVSLNTPGATRYGSGGKVLAHVEVAIRDGEIIVRGNPFLGYLGQPESWAAKEIATGDLGQLSKDGFVRVHGRKKNVLISSYGRNISPEWVESEILACGFFTQALVMGEGRPFCIALLLVAEGSAGGTAVARQIQALNLQLPDYARIGAWQCLDAPLAAVPGLLTSNGRPRRDRIAKHFAAQIEQLYSESMETSPV